MAVTGSTARVKIMVFKELLVLDLYYCGLTWNGND